jgi:hypothetical protein
VKHYPLNFDLQGAFLDGEPLHALFEAAVRAGQRIGSVVSAGLARGIN